MCEPRFVHHTRKTETGSLKHTVSLHKVESDTVWQDV